MYLTHILHSFVKVRDWQPKAYNNIFKQYVVVIRFMYIDL